MKQRSFRAVPLLVSSGRRDDGSPRRPSLTPQEQIQVASVVRRRLNGLRGVVRYDELVHLLLADLQIRFGGSGLPNEFEAFVHSLLAVAQPWPTALFTPEGEYQLPVSR